MKLRLIIFALFISIYAVNAQQQHVVVAPLLKTSWSQWTPYNNLCPKGCPTGCVITATAQVMNYWQWPKSGFGTATNEGTGITVDFSKSTYDWEKMKNNYEVEAYTLEEADAIAHLMYDLGFALGAKYSPSKTTSNISGRIMYNHFGYSNDWTTLSNASIDEISKFIKDELDAGRPVLYRGDPSIDSDSVNGHALVCDGYTSDGYFHFNYGWGGLHDGWYKLGELYVYNNNIVVYGNIQPADGVLTTVGDFTYQLYPNGEADVTDCSLTSGNITIPAAVTVGDTTYLVTNVHIHGELANKSFDTVTIGNNVRRISPQSFVATQIKTLIIGDAVESICAEAFAASGIQNLTIGKSVRYIGDKAFMATSLSNVTCYSKELEVGDFAFQSTYVKDAEWLSHITRMGEQAFANTKLESPEFSNIVEIGSRALAGNSLVDVNLPMTLKKIATDAFWGTIMYNINIDEKNPWYCTDESGTMILNHQKTRLIMAIPTKMYDYAYTVPSSVIAINENAFPREAKSVKLNASIIEMEKAFAKCENLKSLYCYSEIPPVISDETFMSKIFNNDPKLYVPHDCQDTYRNATGWRLFSNIYPELEDMPLESTSPIYSMIAHCSDGTTHSFRTSEIDNVKIGNGNTLNIAGEQEWESPLSKIDSITWKKDIIYDDSEVFRINDSTLTADALYCSVTFDPTVIDEETTVSIRSTIYSPTKMEGAVQSKIFDICLGNGMHELTGTAQIRIPMSLNENEIASGAWYNPTTGEWIPANTKYDITTNELVISTNHLSTFGAFTIDKRYTRESRLIANYLPENELPLTDIAKNLQSIVTDSDPLLKATDFYVNDVSTALQLGNDFTFNALKGFGFESEFLDKFSENLGYFGTALSTYQIARAAYQGNDELVAGGTLKIMLGQATSALSNALSSKVMSASMASVAFIDYAVNRFAEEAWSGRKDLYKAAFNYYYSKAGRNAVNPGEGRGFRTAVDWYKALYPVFSRTDLDEEGMKNVIDSMVVAYCWEYWENEDAQSICTSEATNMGYTYSGGLNFNIKSELSNELRANLYNGTLVSVFQSIKNHKENDAYDDASKYLDDYCNLMNRIVTIRISDSNAKEKSEYAGYTMKFASVNENITDPELWQCKLDSMGKGFIQYRVFAYTDAGFSPELILVSPDDEELMRYPFTMDYSGNKIIAEIDLSGNGIEIPAEDGWNFELNPQYALDEDDQPVHLLVTDSVHLWDGIKDVLVGCRTISPASDGSFSISADGVTMNGVVDVLTHTGSGTFSIEATTEYTNPISEAVFFDSWWSMAIGNNVELPDCWLKDYTAHHKLEGTFNISYSNKAQCYMLHFSGTGTCSMSGSRYTSADSSVINVDGPVDTWSFTERKMDTESVHLTNAQETMDCELLFK
ncbi:MAG: C10 family peptidase [Paludibacteraceae bacterium]|nr:C10 family peptidase [Paludibacteraceae bacterium]